MPSKSSSKNCERMKHCWRKGCKLSVQCGFPAVSFRGCTGESLGWAVGEQSHALSVLGGSSLSSLLAFRTHLHSSHCQAHSEETLPVGGWGSSSNSSGLHSAAPGRREGHSLFSLFVNKDHQLLLGSDTLTWALGHPA